MVIFAFDFSTPSMNKPVSGFGPIKDFNKIPMLEIVNGEPANIDDPKKQNIKVWTDIENEANK